MRRREVIVKISKAMSVFAAILLIGCLPVASYAETTLCDLLAAHPDDPDRTARGVEREDMDLKQGEAACRSALSRNPTHARTNHQLGRVLYYQGREEEGVKFITVAARAGYREAIFVLGYVYTTGVPMKTDYCAAGRLWLQAASLDHAWAGYFLTQAALDSRFDSCEFELSSQDLRRLARLASENITISESQGRVEAMNSALDRLGEGALSEGQ